MLLKFSDTSKPSENSHPHDDIIHHQAFYLNYYQQSSNVTWNHIHTLSLEYFLIQVKVLLGLTVIRL